jgi:hypothetical protein
VRSIYNVLNKGARPHPTRRTVYEEVALAFAKCEFSARGEVVTSDPSAMFNRYLRRAPKESSLVALH